MPVPSDDTDPTTATTKHNGTSGPRSGTTAQAAATSAAPFRRHGSSGKSPCRSPPTVADDTPATENGPGRRTPRGPLVGIIPALSTVGEVTAALDVHQPDAFDITT